MNERQPTQKSVEPGSLPNGTVETNKRTFLGLVNSLGYKAEDLRLIVLALGWAEKQHATQRRASGEPYVLHPIKVACILAEMKMDAATVMAGLLHDVLEDTSSTRKDLRVHFGVEVEQLVNGVTKTDLLKRKDRTIQESETIRKMFLATVRDIRVIFIKLIDRFHNMQTLHYLPADRQGRIARECLEIYAPLAGKLGLYWLKSELEDLSLKTLHPKVYEQIKELVSQKKDERKAYLGRVKNDIQSTIHHHARKDHLSPPSLEIEITSRAKHFYSIYNKMKAIHYGGIYDALGIRILCKTITDCYTVMGIIHQLWKPLAGRFKDYIAMPKENSYQSLHTTVMCYEGRPLEVQIRTYEMHEVAEYGIAAHWLYKENREAKPQDLKESRFMSKLRDWNQQKLHYQDYFAALKKDLLQNSIFVFTPAGDIIELPKGATGIDFAYHIHTEVGDHCVGVRADDKIIPLTKTLENTQTISVMTSPRAHPHVNWLRYVATSRARSKIRWWLRKHDPDVVIERNIVARKRQEATPKDSSSPQQPPIFATPQKSPPPESDRVHKLDRDRVGVSINHEKNLMIRIARCCNPTMGDRIIGFVSRGRGIIVHKKDCRNLTQISEFKERKINVEWETDANKVIRHLKIYASYKPNLFSEVEGAIHKYRGHLISGSLNETERGDLEGHFVIELDKVESCKRILSNIRLIPFIKKVQKVEADSVWNQHSSRGRE